MYQAQFAKGERQNTLTTSENLFPTGTFKTAFEMKSPLESEKAFIQAAMFPKLFINAFKSILEREFTNLDPLLGDTSCQIRAYEISRLANNKSFISNCKMRINEFSGLLGKIEKEKNTYKPAKGKSAKLEFGNFINDYNFDFSFSEDELFLMQSYMLTLSKKQEVSFAGPLKEKTDYNILRGLCGISARLSRKIILTHQEMLSFASINIIAREADTATTKRMASIDNYIAIDSNNRYLLPLYLIMRVLINKMKSEKTPFLLKSERFINEISIDVNFFFTLWEKMVNIKQHTPQQSRIRHA